MKSRRELDVRSVPQQMLRPDSLNYQKFLDNPIPLGDMLRTFLCQFSPSPLVKPHFSSCSSTMQDRALCIFSFLFLFFFACSLISFLSKAATPEPPDSMQFMQMTCLSCFNLNETSRHAHTHSYARTHAHTSTQTHMRRLMPSCSYFSFFFFFVSAT